LGSRLGSTAAAGTPHSGLWLGLMAGWRDASRLRLCWPCAARRPHWQTIRRRSRRDRSAAGTRSPAARPSRFFDGRTFVLDGGREVRLAGIEVAPLVRVQDRRESVGRAAAAALGALATGDQVVLRRKAGPIVMAVCSPMPTRYGTAMSSCCSGSLWPRDWLGSAAAWPIPAPAISSTMRKGPVRPNLAYGPIHIMRCSTTPRAPGMSGVRCAKAPTIYVNFGRRPIGDITVTILKRNERTFAAAGLDLRKSGWSAD